MRKRSKNQLQGYFWNTHYYFTFALFLFWIYLWTFIGNFAINHSTDIFVGILGASATIFAIFYSFSQFTLSRLAENYSPFIQKYFIHRPGFRVSFFLLFATILVSIFSLSIEPGKLNCDELIQNKINSTDISDICKHELENINNIKSSLIYANIFLFSISLIAFTNYFLFMIKSLNAIDFSRIIRDLAINKLRTIPASEFIKKEISNSYGIDFEILFNMIGSIGDTSIKLLDRHESRSTIHYIQSIKEIAKEFLLLKKESEKSKEDELENHSTIELKNNPIVLILFQLERIFKFSYEKEELDVSKEIITTAEDILKQILENRNNDYLIELFTNLNTGNPFFLHIQQIISKDKTDRPEKKLLTVFFFRTVHLCKYEDRIRQRYLDYFLPDCMFNLAKIMIENNDLHSFKSYMEASVIFIQGDPSSLAYQIESDLTFDISDPLVNEIIDDFDLRYKIQILCQQNITYCKNLNSDIKSYSEHLRTQFTINQKEFDEKVEELLKKVWIYYAHSLAYKATFWIGAYILFKKSEPFLNTLWNINTADENIGKFGNEPLISKSAQWNILFYNFESNDKLRSYFDLFRDPYLHLEKFFLMTLLRSYDYSLGIITEDMISKIFQKNKFEVIKNLLRIVHTIKNYKISEKLKNFADEDINKIIKKKDFIQDVNQTLEYIKKDAEIYEKIINKYIVPDALKIQKLVRGIKTNYANNSLMDSISNVTYQPNRDSSFEVFLSESKIDKESLWGIHKYDQLSDYASVFAQRINKFELESYVKTIQNNKKIQKIHSKSDQLFYKLEKEFQQMKKNRSEPDIIMISFSLQGRLEKLSGQQISGFLSIGGKNLLVLSSNSLEKNAVYLLSKNTIQTIYKDYSGNRLLVAVITDDDDLIHAIVQPLLSFKIKIVKPKSITKVIVT